MKFVRLRRDPKLGFGMVITCGNTYDTVLHGAFVEAVHPGSPADLTGSISPGDQIMSINGTNVQSDHFLTVVDLLQSSTSPVDFVIAKTNDGIPDIPAFLKSGFLEKSFSETKTWTVGNQSTKEKMPSLEKVEAGDAVSSPAAPVPAPRKKWTEPDKPHFSVPDLTLNHLSNGKLAEIGSRQRGEAEGVVRDNIPDIIASQMRKGVVLLDQEPAGDSLLPALKEDVDNFLLPGEVFHVVLDKKKGSLGLNIYQGTESPLSDERHIYIHSVIPNGAADLDGRIKPGDKLLEVDGESLEDLSYQEVVTRLRETAQVAHLVLEKGDSPETAECNSSSSSTPVPKETDHPSRNGHRSNTLRNSMNRPDASKRPGHGTGGDVLGGKPRSGSLDIYHERDAGNLSDYSSLPTLSSELESFHDAVDATPETNYSPKRKSKRPSPLNAKICNITPQQRFQKPLTSYRSTPNLAENSDDDEEESHSMYRIRSIESLTPHFMQPHQALMEYYQQYSYLRGTPSNSQEFPSVPIRKKKLKKLDDIYNYSNDENTFEVRVQKSSRGLGLSISGGADAPGRDPFSQLIRIRKLYPLQPALECGRLALGDVILEVNGTRTVGLSNTEALEVLRSAPTDVCLKIFRPSKSLIPVFSHYKGALWPFCESSSSSANSSLSCKDSNTYNVETGDFEITLVKREGSLGFTILRNESMIENAEGIYIKALVREPAVSDGRIQPGDKILQVNGTPVSAMSHAEAIEFMRNTASIVTLRLQRCDPPLSPGDDPAVSKPLRWEAVSFLNDRVKSKEGGGGCPNSRKIKRKLGGRPNCHSPPGGDSSAESATSGSSCSSAGREHAIEEGGAEPAPAAPSPQSPDSADGVGLQRNQRPKSLDMLNASDRKRCSAFAEEEASLHRQASVMACPNEAAEGAEGGGGTAKKAAGKTLLKWRGSTLPHSGEQERAEGCESPGAADEDVGEEEEEVPVPFPRTTSRETEWVNTFDVDLDRGWHGRLGFSLFDPSPTSPGSPRDKLPKACEVKAVYPGSLADKDGRIRVGDRLVEVNRECILSKSAAEVIEILRRTRGLIRMVFCRLETRT